MKPLIRSTVDHSPVDGVPSFVAIVPVKRLHEAKTRLDVSTTVRRALAMAFAVDTVTAVTRCRAVVAVVVVTADPRVRRSLRGTGVHFVGESGCRGLVPALNAACRGAAEVARGHACVVVPADLPALSPADLGAVLDQSGGGDSFVRDTDGHGTTLLVTAPGASPRFQYGVRSAERHEAAGFRELVDVPASARQDVDCLDDLEAAARLGVGAVTAAVLSRLRVSAHAVSSLGLRGP